MSDQDCAAVPLLERMRSIPKDWREMREIGWCHHQNVPYGHMLHEAADALEAQAGEIERLRALLRETAVRLKDLAWDWDCDEDETLNRVRAALAPDVTEIVIDSPQEKI